MEEQRNNEQSVRFDLVYSRPEMAFGVEPEPELARFIKSTVAKGKALDLGCGDGRHALFLASNGYQVTGVDVSQVAINKLEKIAQSENLNSFLKLHHGDARDIDYPSEKYDFVAAVTLFDHVPQKDLRPLFDKVAGSLKKDGVIFIKVHTVKDPGKLNGSDKASELSWAIQHYFKAEELRELLETKFKILKYSEYDDLDNSHGKPHFHNFAMSLAQKF